MGPPSLQDDSITEPAEYAIVNKPPKTEILKQDFLSSSTMHESTSSVDLSTQEFEGVSMSTSKIESSLASDSGLIGE